MNNPFKRIIHHHNVPEVLKKKVLSDIGMIKLTLDIADLFLVKYPNTIGDLLNSNNKNSNNQN